MFNFFKNSLQSIYAQFTHNINALFSRPIIDENTLKELEALLIQADAGVKTTRTIMQNVRDHAKQGHLQKGEDLKKLLQKELCSLLIPFSKPNARVFLLVGINGSGKTTCAGKLAYQHKQQNKQVLLAAADTFRAAATEQLAQWASTLQTDLVVGTHQQDPGSVVFNACKKFKDESYDTLIIDTAGRLQTKTNLMQELAKIKRIIGKHIPEEQLCTLLTLDAILGQNSREQAELFHQSTRVDGVVLTKMDGTGKGGIVFAINHHYGIPVAYLSFGEKHASLKSFDAHEYVDNLLNE